MPPTVPTAVRERQILEVLRTHGPCTRRELAERLGCYPSLLQHAINRLHRRGVLRIAGYRRSHLAQGITHMGRASETLALSPEAAS